jgi:hypothetical protein
MGANSKSRLQPRSGRFRVSVRALLLYMLVYACFFAIVAAGPTTTIEMSVATGVVTAFVLVDVWRGPHPAGIPRLAQSGAFVGYYSLAIALAGLSCLLLRMNAPSPPPSGKSFLEFWADFEQSVAEALGPFIYFFGVFLWFSVLGFLASQLAVRQIRSAKWLVLACLPGTGWLTVVWIYESLPGNSW